MEKEKSAAKKRQLDSQASDHVEKVSWEIYLYIFYCCCEYYVSLRCTNPQKGREGTGSERNRAMLFVCNHPQPRKPQERFRSNFLRWQEYFPDLTGRFGGLYTRLYLCSCVLQSTIAFMSNPLWLKT
jgi:hypothetical protein